MGYYNPEDFHSVFFVFRLFFFPNYLKSNFDSDADRSMHVIQRLTEIIN